MRIKLQEILNPTIYSTNKIMTPAEYIHKKRSIEYRDLNLGLHNSQSRNPTTNPNSLISKYCIFISIPKLTGLTDKTKSEGRQDYVWESKLYHSCVFTYAGPEDISVLHLVHSCAPLYGWFYCNCTEPLPVCSRLLCTVSHSLELWQKSVRMKTYQVIGLRRGKCGTWSSPAFFIITV